MSLSWARSIQFMSPHLNSWRSIIIFSYHLRLGLPSGLFLSGFPTKTLYIYIYIYIYTSPLLSPTRATFPASLFLLHVITRKMLSEEYRSLSSSLCSFLHSPVTWSLIGSNIFLNTLFSYTLRLRSFLNVSDQVSHPYKTAGKIIVLYILIFIFLDDKLEDKWFCAEWLQAFPDQFAFNFFLNRISICSGCSQIY